MVRHKLAAICVVFGVASGPVTKPPEFLTQDEIKIEKLKKQVQIAKREKRSLRQEARRLRQRLALPIIVRIGKALQKRGYRVSEHAYFDTVDYVHSSTSKHYPPCSCAIDVNWMGEDEPARLDWVAGRLELLTSRITVSWRTAGHGGACGCERGAHLHAEAA